ncbi:carboxypeptidase family protein [Edaphobacter aggregans]|uniref:Carboxypeptidase family protein n=1 Tax=Edaphobacter aggregans TaxID=570835 RepID=A0A3R9QK76_9BACT|nr:carboxypeptidase-like regulatory domain-containing protein [Edaphobacter aggregans]RSL18503.1 carboxypeptidase family protein [Edaphobacter aggregans]
MNCPIVGGTSAVHLGQPALSLVRRAFLLLIFIASGSAISSPMYGQGTGSFSGTVVDKSGSNVSGASVTATSAATGLARVGKTDNTGHYLIPLLPVGNYTVRVESTGFQTVEARDLTLQVDEARELNFTLVLANVTTTVEVNATAVATETSNPSLGQVITSQQVSQLPLNGRNFVQLATLTAGATAETNPNSFFTSAASSEVAARGPLSLSVGGSRPNSTDWLLDNVDNNELTAGGIAIYSSIDSIQEFKVLTYTYSAEYGTRAGPTVLVTSKSGTNAFHGTLYEFFRNTALDAKSYFATEAEKFNLNQFGGSIGGPIRKNKTFFFVDGEQKYQRHGIVFTGLIPSLAMRTGDFSADAFGNPVSGLQIVNPNMIGASANPNIYPNVYFQCNALGQPLPSNPDGSQPNGVACNKIPSSLINNIGQAMMNLYPTPNASNANAGYNYVNTPVRELDNTKFDIRVDNNFTDADSVFARFSYDQAFSFVPGGSPGFAAANAFGTNQDITNHGRNLALGWTHVFSANMVNQFNFGYNRIFNYITSYGSGTCASATIVPGGIPNANLGCSGTPPKCTPGAFSCGLVSTIVAGGFWAVGDRGYSPFQGGTNIFSYRDSLDLTHGRHNLHFGIDFRANQMNVGTEAFQDGFWIIGNGGNFSGLSTANIPGSPPADFMIGITGLAIHDQTFNGPITGRRWKIFRPFAEDDWRITNSLTLNLGLAWDLTSPISEAHGRLANYVPATGDLLIANRNGVSSSAGVERDWTALEPRVGGAWKVVSNGNTVLRAGFAMFHDSAWSQGAQGLWQNPPFFGESDAFASAGCAFPTSYCATVLGQTPSAISLSSGFEAITEPPTVGTFTGSFYTQPTNFKMGRVQQYNVNVQQVVPGNVVITAGYAGSRGTHVLVAGNNLNTASPSACVGSSSYTLGCLPGGAPYIPPYNTFSTISLFGDVGKTNYDSLQIKAETKALQHGLYALIAYSYSHTYDNGLSDGLGSLLSAPYFPLPNWQNLDWALSQINLNHSFIGSVIYDLPFGRGRQFGNDWNTASNAFLGDWQVTVIQRVSTGFPTPLIYSNNQSGSFFQNGGNGNNWNRPSQVSGCDVHAGNHAVKQFINPACFVAPPIGQLGNASRVPVFGPDFVNTDFSVIKQFTLPREMGLNFRAEFFNLWNHAQFGLPVNDLAVATLNPGGTIQNSNGFGAANSTVNNPRLVQFALKLTF